MVVVPRFGFAFLGYYWISFQLFKLGVWICLSPRLTYQVFLLFLVCMDSLLIIIISKVKNSTEVVNFIVFIVFNKKPKYNTLCPLRNYSYLIHF